MNSMSLNFWFPILREEIILFDKMYSINQVDKIYYNEILFVSLGSKFSFNGISQVILNKHIKGYSMLYSAQNIICNMLHLTSKKNILHSLFNIFGKIKDISIDMPFINIHYVNNVQLRMIINNKYTIHILFIYRGRVIYDELYIVVPVGKHKSTLVCFVNDKIKLSMLRDFNISHNLYSQLNYCQHPFEIDNKNYIYKHYLSFIKDLEDMNDMGIDVNSLSF
ncbi:MAG: hypothetical protein AAFO15_02020, partial [Pseudomonadota bacterium]